jgi:hypothetical protein
MTGAACADRVFGNSKSPHAARVRPNVLLPLTCSFIRNPSQ